MPKHEQYANSGFSCLETFSSRPAAQFVKSVLESSGIEAHLDSDDCGGLDPALAFARGVHLYVATEELRNAKNLLAEIQRDMDSGER